MSYCRKFLLVVLFLTMSAGPVAGQRNSRNKLSVASYINKYKAIAISEMKRTKVPASITLAQGILESKYGNSYLSRKGRNHFGIKCHNGWSGRKVYARDDNMRSCFRKYKSVYASYIDHSNFLSKNKRYRFLFNLKAEDYAGWATGLKKAGYATDPAYSRRLIALIKKYELFKFDKPFLPDQKNTQCKEAVIAMPSLYNGVKTVMFNCAITPDRVVDAYSIDKKKLLRYNSLAEKEVIPANTVVYLQPLKNKAPRGLNRHKATRGETISSIAQLYGIKPIALAKKNRVSTSTVLKEGEVVNLRKKKKVTATKKSQKVNYIVKKGDTLYNIANRFGISVKTIKTSNKLRSNLIKPGQKLKININ